MSDLFALALAGFVGFGLGAGLTWGAFAVRMLRRITDETDDDR